MPSLLESVRGVLLDSSSIVDKVVDRVIPDELEQGVALPAIVFRRISGQSYDQLEGRGAGIARSRIQIECYSGNSRKEADELAELVRLSDLLIWQGERHGTDVRSVVIDENATHFTEPNTEGSHELRYVTSIDFEFHFLEAV